MSVPAAEDIQQETLLVHAGAPSLVDGAGPVNTPVIRTSTVRFRDTATQTAYQQLRAQGEPVATYGRHGLETHRALEQAVSSLEGGYRSFLTPSGLSAITLVLLSLLSPGDHVLVSDSVYSPIRRVDKTLLKRLGIDVEYFSVSDSTLSQKFKPNTRLLYVESPSSLLYEVLDLPELAALARARGVLVATDNTWSGGFFYKPLTLGANISIQASTKYIGGHSDLMQGIVTVDTPELFALIAPTYEALGLTVGADDAYLALRGLRTLSVRLRQHQVNALEVARYLAQHSGVSRVFYPALESDPGHRLWKRDFSGASGLISFEFSHASVQAAHTFVDALSFFGIGASWGGYESLALMAAPERLQEHSCWTGSHPVVRLHIGLESPLDLIADIKQAFDTSNQLHLA